MDKKINALIIMDGFGVSGSVYGNAIKKAATPNLDKLFSEYPNTVIGASGMDVGLPDGQMGNSEVGHLNMGAGRIVYQELTRITKSIKDGDFFDKAELLSAVKRAKDNNKKLHVYGLLSDGGVHSHIEHLFALIKMAKSQGLNDIYIHCFLDGRDVPPKSGADFIKQLKAFIATQQFGSIATVMGRYYAMDRDNRWERVQKAYDALTMGEGVDCDDAEAAVRSSYTLDVTDEFVLPSVVKRNGIPVARIEEGDSIIFFNFRPDRAREITRAFIEREFKGFDRKSGYIAPYYVGMTQYDASFTDIITAFKPQSLKNTLGEVLAANALKQLRIAETEKYAHVTFFFNGGVEVPNKGEDRVLIPSPKVATYDMKPTMSALETAEKAAELVRSGKYDVMVLNFANCDMVGHTGVFDAAVEAVETVDKSVGIVLAAVLEQRGNAIITADHGNADKMYEEDGSPFTAHSTNPVPFIVVTDKPYSLRQGGVLADVAPTLLQLMGIEQPEEMTGKSIIS
ncbi:MAG: 2,3-bisphosphoglycerate-independent phosphoglycerate mutase [Clostridia bacterium]|nr:2,3-bisphosphoglycerate-independent phosphoglycerate mutase [Clostridia bacterium]